MEKKSSVSDWRSRLASKFKKSSTDQYEVNGQDNGEPSLSSYRKTSHELDAPMTEPTRRRTLGSVQNGRKVSQNGEYDSEMVDGKYVTSVPILNPEDEEEEGGKLSFIESIFVYFRSIFLTFRVSKISKFSSFLSKIGQIFVFLNLHLGALVQKALEKTILGIFQRSHQYYQVDQQKSL